MGMTENNHKLFVNGLALLTSRQLNRNIVLKRNQVAKQKEAIEILKEQIKLMEKELDRRP